MLAALEAAEDAITMIGSPDQISAWRAAQKSVSELASAPGIVSGRCVRLLLDVTLLTPEEAGRLLARVLSARDRTPYAVSWLDGFLRGSGLLLLRDAALWQLLDDWLCALNESAFDEALPLLRRAFSQFPWPERRQMGERVRTGRPTGQPPSQAGSDDWDEGRVRSIMPVLAAALGACRAHETPDGPAADMTGLLGG
jgi:hypothetical protein